MLEDVTRRSQEGGFKAILRAHLIPVTNPALDADLVVYHGHIILQRDGADITIRQTDAASDTFLCIYLHLLLQ
jgi:hypothetical protein